MVLTYVSGNVTPGTDNALVLTGGTQYRYFGMVLILNQYGVLPMALPLLLLPRPNRL